MIKIIKTHNLLPSEFTCVQHSNLQWLQKSHSIQSSSSAEVAFQMFKPTGRSSCSDIDGIGQSSVHNAVSI